MLIGGGPGGVPMTAPACARAVGSRRDLVRLATVVTASTTPMATSDTAVVISGTRGLSPWPQCRISFTPMNARMSARPLDRYTSRSSRPVTRKNSARRPSRAKALAVKTM